MSPFNKGRQRGRLDLASGNGLISRAPLSQMDNQNFETLFFLKYKTRAEKFIRAQHASLFISDTFYNGKSFIRLVLWSGKEVNNLVFESGAVLKPTLLSIFFVVNGLA